jgi:acrylyl-CoA reductase (NADPH)
MSDYRAFRIHQDDRGHHAGIEQLPLVGPSAGEILIRAHYSSVNYKDALAGTGKGKILRRFPLNGGIDVAGEVAESRDRRFRAGDGVLVTGYGLGVESDGGYAELVRVPADWAIPLPEGLGPFDAMALGTAGFTAALAIHRMEQNGQHPSLGPVVVTGASGGVGCIALDLLSALGYETAAVSRKGALRELLTTLGAGRILARDELPGVARPLEKAVWGGALDNVGGAMLANLTRTVVPWGNIASIGLAGGHELRTTVMPFILRAVSLLGIDSGSCPYDLRQRLWRRLATDLRPRHLDRILDRTVTLDQLPEVFADMLAGNTHGRTVVQIF